MIRKNQFVLLLNDIYLLTHNLWSKLPFSLLTFHFNPFSFILFFFSKSWRRKKWVSEKKRKFFDVIKNEGTFWIITWELRVKIKFHIAKITRITFEKLKKKGFDEGTQLEQKNECVKRVSIQFFFFLFFFNVATSNTSTSTST